MQSAEELLRDIDQVQEPFDSCEYGLYSMKRASLIRARDREIVEACKKIAGPYADRTAPISTAPRLAMDNALDFVMRDLG